MPDANLDWDADFSLAPNGDLSIVDGVANSNQAIIRRLLTAVNGYIFHLTYGAGLPQRIGLTARANDIQSLVRAQILLEATVAQNPQPIVTLAKDLTVTGAYIITIKYIEAATGKQTSLTFSTAN